MTLRKERKNSLRKLGAEKKRRTVGTPVGEGTRATRYTIKTFPWFIFFFDRKKKIIKSEIVEQKQAQGEQKKSGIIAVFDDVCMSELINLIERSSHDDWRGGKGEV